MAATAAGTCDGPLPEQVRVHEVQVRCSGASIGCALGAVPGGASAPTTALSRSRRADRAPVHGQVHGGAVGQTGTAVTTMLST